MSGRVHAGAVGTRAAACAAGVCALAGMLHGQQTVPASPLPVELVGVVVDSRVPSRSGCLVRCTYPEELRRTSVVEVGRTACDLAEVRDVHEDAVVILNLLTNRTERLAFRPPDGGRDAPAPAVAAPPPPPRVVAASRERVSVELEKGTVDHYLANLPDFLNSAVATPHYLDTGGLPAVDGFTISRVKAGGAVAAMGLRDGDVIEEANGERLDSLATVLRLFGQARSATSTTLTVRRNGERLAFTFRAR